MVHNPAMLDREQTPPVGLFRLMHAAWRTVGAMFESEELPDEDFRCYLQRMLPDQRATLLLVSLEGFTLPEVGAILGRTPAQVRMLLDTALNTLPEHIPLDVLIIEDEIWIALDLSRILRDMGHNVVHIARSRREAVAAADSLLPDLILADIQLADQSSGLKTVEDILSERQVPIVFVTAHAERLHVSPQLSNAQLVTKPFLPTAIRSAVRRAIALRDAGAAA